MPISSPQFSRFKRRSASYIAGGRSLVHNGGYRSSFTRLYYSDTLSSFHCIEKKGVELGFTGKTTRIAHEFKVGHKREVGVSEKYMREED